MIRQVLERIEDWPARAQSANYCVHTLAEHCHVSVQSLGRFFAEVKGKCPWDWLHDERMKRARELLLDGSTVKGTAARLGYLNPYHFSREFTKHHGYAPSQHSSRITRGRGAQNTECRE